jgi:hypothetical protein
MHRSILISLWHSEHVTDVIQSRHHLLLQLLCGLCLLFDSTKLLLRASEVFVLLISVPRLATNKGSFIAHLFKILFHLLHLIAKRS